MFHLAHVSVPLASVPRAAAPEPTRDAVLRAAAALLATDSGASLAEIAAAAGVGRTTVHRAFPTRADLLTALALDAVGPLSGAIDGGAARRRPRHRGARAGRRRWCSPSPTSCAFLDAGPEVWDLPQLRDAWWSITSALDALVERGQREGDLRADIPAEVVVEAFTGMLLGRRGRASATAAWPRPPRRATSSRLALAGVTPPTGAAR